MSEAFEDIKPGTHALAETIAQKRAELSAKRIILTEKYAASLPLQWRVKAYKPFKEEVVFSYANIYSFLHRRTTASS